MNKRQLSFEDLIYILAFALALGVRMLNLGVEPLSDLEAASAISALDLPAGDAAALPPQPGYLALTGMAFSLLGSSNALARLWPALAGSLMVLIPLLGRHRLGRKAALFLAFGLALDPGLVALSRQVGGQIMAISFGTLVLTLFFTRKPAWSGIFAGLALLSGPAVWVGLLGLGIALGMAVLVRSVAGRGDRFKMAALTEHAGFSQQYLRVWFIFTCGTVLLVGTIFTYFPAGLSLFGKSLTVFLQGWGSWSGVPAGRLLAAVGVYLPLALIFAGVAAGRDWERGRWFVLWFLAALAVVLVYPARQVGDVAWVIVPLWTLAGLAFSDDLMEDWRERVSLGQAATVVVLLVMAWLTLAGMRFDVADALRVRWLLIGGVFVLGVLSVVFVGLGWSWGVARSGTVLGVLVAFGLYTLAAMFGLSQVRPGSPTELWFPPPQTGQADLLAGTLTDLSLRQTGDANSLDGVVLLDSPALRWVLREFSDIVFVSSLEEGALPAVVIAPVESETMAWAAAYRGQDFVWRLSPSWLGGAPSPWVDWFVFRDAPLESTSIILWARGDLFPDEEGDGKGTE
ncbi:MAG: hypothetical protein U9Q82_14560 [Chloroflexota bacterium]|nr:hypothetical protein [Chloroflexota bacterium]